jgi:glycosyltransferase involved in cell wall biosynthesis
VRIIALLQARDEQRFLPGWLENVAPAVDGIVALDDGSADGTADLLRSHPNVVEVLQNPAGGNWDERANQMALLKAGRRHGSDWFITIDADERLEQRLVRDLRTVLVEAEARQIEACSLQLRELWNNRRHYRTDGLWRGKARFRLFRNRDHHTKFDPRPLHRHWMPLEIATNLSKVGAHLPYNLYHLRMIRPEDRAARHERYRTLDPDARYQPQGYDYLVDETGMVLEPVGPDRDFLPADDPAAKP